MADIDETLRQLEDLYRRITGGDFRPPQTTAIPAEREPVAYVEEQLERLVSALRPEALPGLVAATPLRVSWPLCVSVEIHVPRYVGATAHAAPPRAG
jgi:hypothetical protein